MAEKDNGWLYLLLIAGAAAIIYFLSKNSQQTTPVKSSYDNDENWELVRGEGGFIENLRVARHANVGNNDSSYMPSYMPSVGRKPFGFDGSNSQRIDIDELTDKIQQRLENRYTNLNVKQSDLYRRQRFGMA